MTASARVLVVDDDDGIRHALVDFLGDEGFRVASVSNGAEALDWLRCHPVGESCVVLLDLMMPVMDGAQFLAKRASDADLAKVPVVVITAGGGCADIRRRFDVQDCIPKPLSFPRLLGAIQACR
jgi:two-component system, chemotaxis family, chemotaxis protein CheY